MSSAPVLGGLATVRSHTWPPTASRRRLLKLRALSASSSTIASILSSSMTSNLNDLQSDRDSFEDELNENPDAHFLSPMQLYEYEDWADDSDDDDADEVEWNAGILDFALFDRDRRDASARHEHVPGKWQSLLDSQVSALQRAVERNLADNTATTNDHRQTPQVDEIPQLTPDNSPNLRDHFDIEAYCGGRARRPSIPNYLNDAQIKLPSKILTPVTRQHNSDDRDADIDFEVEDFDGDELSMSHYDDDDVSSIGSTDSESDVPVSVLVQQARERRLQYRKLQRPGLRYSRTMSGRAHVWRRPSYHIYTLGEDVEGEAAELDP